MSPAMIAIKLVVAGEAEKLVIATASRECIVGPGSNPDIVLSGHVGFLRSAAWRHGHFRSMAAMEIQLNLPQ